MKMPVVNPNAACIDIGATQNDVCAPADSVGGAWGKLLGLDRIPGSADDGNENFTRFYQPLRRGIPLMRIATFLSPTDC